MSFLDKSDAHSENELARTWQYYKAVAKAKVCLQAAQQHQKKFAAMKCIDVQFEIEEMAWLNSQHVTLKDYCFPAPG